LSALGPTAKAVKAQRRALPAEHPGRKLEAAQSEVTSATLDLYRGLRDAVSEAAFFLIYGNLHTFNSGDERLTDPEAPATTEPRELSWVREALASMEEGGYPDALARVACLLASGGEPLPLAKLQLAHEMLEEYRDLLPDLAPADVRRIAGRQQIIVRYEPEKALETLPALLKSPGDGDRLLVLLDRVFADGRVQRIQPTPEQKEMFSRIRAVLGASRRRLAAPRLQSAAARRRPPSTRIAGAARKTRKAKGKA
jgi:Protein of unknown function (DUF3141)